MQARKMEDNQPRIFSQQVEENFQFISLVTNYTCNLKCSYCCFHFVTDNKRLLPQIRPLAPTKLLAINKFVQFLPDLVMYIQGGEPLLYKGLEELLSGLEFRKTVVVSSLSIPLSHRFSALPRLRDKVKFIGSFHSGQVDPTVFIENASILRAEDMVERICGVEGHISPDDVAALRDHGFETVLYPFTGIKNGIIFPENVREHAAGWVTGGAGRAILCKSAKFLIDPYGRIWNCSSHMYLNNLKYSLGTIEDELEADFYKPTFYKCDRHGYCNPCQGPFVSNKQITDLELFREFPGLQESLRDASENGYSLSQIPPISFLIR
jgi:hypothetical protein